MRAYWAKIPPLPVLMAWVHAPKHMESVTAPVASPKEMVTDMWQMIKNSGGELKG